ncbi:MAG: Uma2 family endonuclease [Anaerolineae bacterium]|nr:Uma2 family endonuclease [Anaerolineae bacterium]
MVLKTRHITDDDFDRFVMLPENADRNFEFIAGEIVEVVSSSKSSRTAVKMSSRVTIHVDDNHLGRVTGADGGYMVYGEKYIPDVAFISYARQPKDPNVAYNPVTPDLAIEVLSPGNTDLEMTRKIGNYLAAGTVVWVADPDTQTIDVYTPNKPRKTLRTGDFIDGGDVLPGFRLAVAYVFSE